MKHAQRIRTGPIAPIHIERQDYQARGSYVATVPGLRGIGRLLYRRERADLLVATHTETSDELRGEGVALALVTRMVEDARRDGVKIYAMCSYVERERRDHPQWADVFVTPT